VDGKGSESIVYDGTDLKHLGPIDSDPAWQGSPAGMIPLKT